MKKLIINADDFGLTPQVNEAILDGHHRGVIGSTSLLANGQAFESAVALSRQAPRLGIGIHLNLTEGKAVAPGGAVSSLVDRQGQFARTPASLWRAVILGQVKAAEIEQEFRAQIEKVRAAGIAPTHVDSHKHVHALPRLGRMTVDLAREYGIPAVRFPAEHYSGLLCLIRHHPAKIPTILRQFAGGCVLAIACLGWRDWHNRARWSRPLWFYGVTPTGFLDSHVLRGILSHIPHGVSELTCHPGLVDSALRRTTTRLLEQREIEYRALTEPAIKAFIQELGIELTSYRDVFCSNAGALVASETNLNQRLEATK